MDKKHLILLPGMMCDERLFQSQLTALQDRWHVAVLPITAHATVPELAASVLAAAPARFALAGLSMGGIVAMEIMRQAPDRVTHLALLDTNPLAETEKVSKGREPQIRAAETGELARVMRDEMKPNYLAETAQRAEILDLCMDMALKLGPEVFVRQSRALQTRPDQTETLRAVRVPSLVLCGRYDALCPISRHELMADLIPGAALEIVENAGHLPTLENPDATNSALQDWLS